MVTFVSRTTFSPDTSSFVDNLFNIFFEKVFEALLPLAEIPREAVDLGILYWHEGDIRIFPTSFAVS